MKNEEAEYRKAFLFQRRWAKHWLTPSAHRAHSSTINMMKPAKKTLEFIESINNKEILYKEKLELLDEFYNNQEIIERNLQCIGSTYYCGCIQFNKNVFNSIAKGESVYIPKISR